MSFNERLKRAALPDADEILSHYPEIKPVCFNYATARLHVMSLLEENARLKIQLNNHGIDA